MTTERLRLRVNERVFELEADPLTPVQSVLHDLLGLRSVRLSCGVGTCGSCTVLLDGEPARSCLVPAALAVEREIVTNEGLADDDPVRAAFVREHAYQCGYCIPGFVLAAAALLRGGPDPAPQGIDAALAGNLCRCGTYGAIRRAVEAARSGRRADRSGAPALSEVDEHSEKAEHERRAGEHDETARPPG